jgi:hypothetical protein
MHYRILNSGKGSKKVFFEVPIAPCGYWVITEGEVVDGFFPASLIWKRRQTARQSLIQREFDITIRRKVTLFKNQLLINLAPDFCGFISF